VNSSSNLLLNSLSSACRDALLPSMDGVPLRHGTVLFERGSRADHAWFVESGMISAVARVDGGERTEVGVIGREGFAGLSILLGGTHMATGGIVQHEGAALRIGADDLRLAIEQEPELRSVLLRYAEAFLIQVSQTAACNVRHTLPHRLARWLLTCCDKTGSDKLELTHDFLSWMLGVRRAGVTGALHILEGEGAIRATRGLVTIRDRAKLEQLACSCNEVIAATSNLLPFNGKAAAPFAASGFDAP
jgi:CRP-like cAMP-binding protein